MEKSIDLENPTPSVSKETLEAKYWHSLLMEGKRPASVYAFTQSIGIEESHFYATVSSFEALESQYWRSLVDETVEILHADSDFCAYSSEQKFLAFFYTFFLNAQKNRSRLVSFFPKMGCLSALKPMRHSFTTFASEVIRQGVAEGSIADRKMLTEKYPRLLFEQLRVIIEFYKKDQSTEFQDTDALIEKSVRLGSDIASAGTLDAAFDLGRFLLRKFTVK